MRIASALRPSAIHRRDFRRGNPGFRVVGKLESKLDQPLDQFLPSSHPQKRTASLAHQLLLQLCDSDYDLN